MYNETEAIKFNKDASYFHISWEEIQREIGASDDGDPGRETAQKASVWQKKNGLANDGKVGSGTLAKMGIEVKDTNISNYMDLFPELVLGLDTSYWQDYADFLKVFLASVEFVTMKGSQGETGRDSKLEGNWENCQDIPKSVYHLGNMTKSKGKKVSSPDIEAENFSSVLSSLSGSPDFHPSLDLETSKVSASVNLVGAAKTLQWIETFIRVFQRKAKLPIMLYLSKNTHDLLGNNVGLLPCLNGWYAEYAISRIGKPPKMKNSNWNKWTFKQFSGNGLCDGVSVDKPLKVDLNYYNGTVSQFRTYLEQFKAIKALNYQ